MRGLGEGALGGTKGEKGGARYRTVTSWCCVGCGDFYKTRTISNSRRDRVRVRGGSCPSCRVRVAREHGSPPPAELVQSLLAGLQLRLSSPS